MLDKKSEEMAESEKEIKSANTALQQLLQSMATDEIKLRQEGMICDRSKDLKKDLLVDLEHKEKIMRDIEKLHKINQEKIQASIDTKKKLLEEQKIELSKVMKKLQPLDIDNARKDKTLVVENENLTQLKKKFDVEFKKNQALERDILEKKSRIRETKIEIENLESKMLVTDNAKPAMISRMDVDYHEAQLDNARDRTRQITRKFQDALAVLKQEKLVGDGLDADILKEKGEVQNITQQIRSLRENFNEIVELKKKVLEKKELSMIRANADFQGSKGKYSLILEGDPSKFALGSKSLELSSKALAKEEETKAAFAKAEAEYAEKLRKLDEQISSLGTRINFKQGQVKEAQIARKAAEDLLQEELYR
jgi:hypothetical protein